MKILKNSKVLGLGFALIILLAWMGHTITMDPKPWAGNQTVFYTVMMFAIIVNAAYYFVVLFVVPFIQWWSSKMKRPTTGKKD